MVQQTFRPRDSSNRNSVSSDRMRINLGKEAVKFALNGDWASAVQRNRAILDLDPGDCEAANRLAKALIELGDFRGARSVLDDLLARHPNNNIARKNLARLENLEVVGGHRSRSGGRSGVAPLFIEEGGKSCTTTLRRSVGDCPLPGIGAGDTVTLTASLDQVIAQTPDGRRLGTVEPRLSRRLRKLILGGNGYSAAVVGASDEQVSIIIREIHRHPSLRDVVSFPSPGTNNANAVENDAQIP